MSGFASWENQAVGEGAWFLLHVYIYIYHFISLPPCEKIIRIKIQKTHMFQLSKPEISCACFFQIEFLTASKTQNQVDSSPQNIQPAQPGVPRLPRKRTTFFTQDRPKPSGCVSRKMVSLRKKLWDGEVRTNYLVPEATLCLSVVKRFSLY